MLVQEPTKHQYDWDVATTMGFLNQYGLSNEFKLNVECNHATLAGHSCDHELQVPGLTPDCCMHLQQLLPAVLCMVHMSPSQLVLFWPPLGCFHWPPCESRDVILLPLPARRI